MADPKIRIKRSAVEGKIPTSDQVPLGEIALNTYDGYLYASKNVGIGTTVITINPFRVGAGTDSYDAYFTSGNVGIGTTNPQEKLEVIGDVRIVGILTVGSSSITLNGDENELNVGTGVTIHHTNGVQVGGNTLHSSGLEVNEINVGAGITINHSNGIQVGQTSVHTTGIEVDSVSVVGVVTANSFEGDGSNLTGVVSQSLAIAYSIAL
jgi:hypothetical protein